jgi:hypothetical protein
LVRRFQALFSSGTHACACRRQHSFMHPFYVACLRVLVERIIHLAVVLNYGPLSLDMQASTPLSLVLVDGWMDLWKDNE